MLAVVTAEYIMPIVKIINNISGFQPGIAGAVAFAYLCAPMVGKVLCKEDQQPKIEMDFQQFYTNICPIACHEPKEITIPLAFVVGTSGDAEVFAIPLA